jgi:hypothetical protein
MKMDGKNPYIFSTIDVADGMTNKVSGALRGGLFCMSTYIVGRDQQQQHWKFEIC